MANFRLNRKGRKNIRNIRKWFLIALIGGGVLAALVTHALNWLAKPEASLITDVKTEVLPFMGESRAKMVSHVISIRNDGDLAYKNLAIHIKFSATSNKPTIRGPVKWADPDSVMSLTTGIWEQPYSYKIHIVDFARHSELFFSFDADQIMEVTLDVLGEEIQYKRVYLYQENLNGY